MYKIIATLQVTSLTFQTYMTRIVMLLFGFLEEKLPAVTMPHQRRTSSQLSPSLTASASTPSTPLLSPATRQATVSLGQIQIHSPNPTSESDTDMASVTTTHQQHFVFPTPKSKGNRPASQTPTTQRQPKRLQYQYNPTSGANKPAVTVPIQPYGKGHPCMVQGESYSVALWQLYNTKKNIPGRMRK